MKLKTKLKTKLEVAEYLIKQKNMDCMKLYCNGGGKNICRCPLNDTGRELNMNCLTAHDQFKRQLLERIIDTEKKLNFLESL